MKIKEVLKLLKRNISFYERKKVLQKLEFCTKGKVYIMNFLDEENADITDFWE